MPASKVIQLRQVLSEKFPGLRMELPELPPTAADDDSSARGQRIGEMLHARLSKGALNEIVAGAKTSGSATLLREIIHCAAARHQIIGLVDGCDSFDVTQVDSGDLRRLLWARCTDADQALKAADLLLRDGNLDMVILDFKFNPESQLRKIPPGAWYRLQRLVETTSAICLVITPRAMAASAKMRFALDSHFSLGDLERDSRELLEQVHIDAVKAPHLHKAVEQKIA